MKIYSAKYSAEHNSEDNSLVANLLKYPEIAKKVVELYPRYTTTYLLEKLGFGASEKVLGDNSFEWKMMGRYRAQQLQGAALDISGETGYVIADTEIPVGGGFTLSIDDTSANPCMINANDIIRLADGSQAHVTSVGVSAASIVVLTCVSLTVISADVADGSIVGVVGNAFGEGSDGASVGEGYAFPETRKNWLTISRKKLVIDARDLTDVTWVEHNGHRLWFFTKEQQTEAQFMYDLEVMRWFGRTSIEQYSATTPGQSSTPVTGVPLIGDGILAQIASANVLTYNETTSGGGDFNLSEDVILDFIGQLSLNAENSTGNEYVVFTGTQGKIQFHKAMKDLLVSTGGTDASVMIDKFGQEVSVGANFSSYFALGNKITVAHCPVFDDPNIATAPGYLSTDNDIDGTGFNTSKLSALMVFLDMGSTQGVANVELITKGAEGINRNFVKKYVPGMVNPYDSKSMMAASGDDKFEVHWLTQSGIIVRNPLSCGILKPTGLTV
tara:strand:+ start:11010 stop:12506 length:1497 start_codon:yes stop_codon:yes gene_type:complete